MTPPPLPPRPTWLDRVEYALGWGVCWMIIWIPGKPLISGFCTGSIIGGVFFAISVAVLHLTGHFKP